MGAGHQGDAAGGRSGQVRLQPGHRPSLPGLHNQYHIHNSYSLFMLTIFTIFTIFTILFTVQELRLGAARPGLVAGGDGAGLGDEEAGHHGAGGGGYYL